jgi:CubicO group peptidase (beta-lactamase class C family)
MSAVIVKDQNVLWARGFGFADLEKRIPATPDTVYYIASLTKTFATTALMQLVEQGKLDLDEPMSNYSDEFKDDKVKVKHVLSHTSGGIPGDRFSYDGARFALLTSIIEKKTGKSFRQVITEMFLDPLNMSDSVPSQDVLTAASKSPELFGKEKLNRYKKTLARYAQPYRLYGKEIVHTTYPWGGISTAAGLLSTAPDLAKFDVAIDRHVYLKKETQEQSWTPFVSNSGRPLVHGLGWFAQNYHGLKCIWHFGNDPDEFSGTYLKLPEKGISLILLANSDTLSRPFYRGGILTSSPFIATFLRIFVSGATLCVGAGLYFAREWAERAWLVLTVLLPFAHIIRLVEVYGTGAFWLVERTIELALVVVLSVFSWKILSNPRRKQTASSPSAT